MKTQSFKMAAAIAAACVFVAPQVDAQSPQVGTSMAEAKKLIERELPLAGDFSKVEKTSTGSPLETKFSIDKVSLSDCRLSFLSTTYLDISMPSHGISRRSAVLLKDVDVSKIRVLEVGVPPGITRNRPYFSIVLNAMSGTDRPFSVESQTNGGAWTLSPTNLLSMGVADNPSATRIAAALRQAAVLCGAPDQAPTAPAESAAPTPKLTSAPNGAMTNDDVLKLVAAGLSDQVIATSIRQAPSKDFDLTPNGLVALKKSNVPDAVIVAMLEKGPTPQAAAATAPPAAPKYDASLAAKPKENTAPPEPSNGCEGIESMGLFKNNTGVGGLVEWLAKIRNNGGITKIVVYGWIDMYGQPQKGQVQIQGGQISSIRLDLTQNMAIPPVKALRLVSCQ